MTRRLLCTDLDRTLIPNGTQTESPQAKALFAQLVDRKDLTLVYVTGRHRRLIEQAILQYELPQPDFAIGDVGTTIYQVLPRDWTLWHDWGELLAESWPPTRVDCLKSRLQSEPDLTLQEEEKQNRFKISYYYGLDANQAKLKSTVQAQADTCELFVNLVWSIDHVKDVGLLDILPAKANKLTAIVHLMSRLDYQWQDTLFAGDSGNDLDVFRSEIPSVVVANAEPEIKRWALESNRERLYVARGGLLELNGNYRSGILEGACHFWPEAARWLQDSLETQPEQSPSKI